MSDWNVRLEGGPADGDEAMTDQMLPSKLWVAWCPDHKEWHWFSKAETGCELYRLTETDEVALTARYVHSDISHGPSISERERELVPA